MLLPQINTMKHAILILAHKDLEQLKHLIEYFREDCYIYIHIDKKASINKKEQIVLENLPQIRAIYRKYSVHWGGFSMLKAELYLLKKSINDCDADYFHLISAQDYPIKPLNKFLRFFENNKGKEFIRYAHIPNSHWDHYSYSRFKYYYPYDFINKETTHAIAICKKIIKWQDKMGIKRRVPDQFDNMFGSTQWFSITREAVSVALTYTRKSPSFYRRAHWTFASEEYYLATILLNNMPQAKFIPTDLRYIHWRFENGNNPANLDMKHFRKLAEDNPFLFARKFDTKYSSPLRDAIDTFLINEPEKIITPEGGWVYNGFSQYSFNRSLAQTIATVCRSLNVESVVDVGCGAGFYVAALRELGIPAMGFDVNPYTPTLSALLLPEGDTPCEVADILDESIEIDTPFDMAICLCLLSSIPCNKHPALLRNISMITGKYLIVAEDYKSQEEFIIIFDSYKELLSEHGFKEHAMGTYMLNQHIFKSNKSCMLFERRS